MSFNGSGAFSINTAGQPVAANTLITSTAFNLLTADLAMGLSTAICKDGQTTITANIPFAGFRATNVGITGIAGSVGTPTVNFSDAATGFYRVGSNSIGVSINGVVAATYTSGSAYLLGTSTDGDGASTGVWRASFASGSLAAAAIFTNSASATAPCLVWSKATTGDNGFINFNTEGSSGTTRGSIDFNRGGTAVRYNTTSDATLKTDLGVSDKSTEAAKILSITVRDYEWKETPGALCKGIFAQELYENFPEAVSPGNDERPWMYDPSKLVPALIATIQHLEERIATLEGKT